jgi:hypothetical protein
LDVIVRLGQLFHDYVTAIVSMNENACTQRVCRGEGKEERERGGREEHQRYAKAVCSLCASHGMVPSTPFEVRLSNLHHSAQTHQAAY